MDTNGQDDEDFPLADHPEYTGPKAGDADMNRARDLRHLDVTRGRQPVQQQASQVSQNHPATTARPANPTPPLPSESPPMKAWHEFATSEHFEQYEHSAMQMFLAGWSARDAKGE